MKKPVFEKGYTNNWTEEIFIICEFIPRSPYIIKDLNTYIIDGIDFEKQLLKINKIDEVYRIKKILDRRIRNRKGS